MNTTVIPPSTSHGVHAGPPGSDPRQIINDLRQHNAASADLEQELALAQRRIDELESMEIVLRNALNTRDATCAQLGLQLVRAEEALDDLAAHAWRLE